MNHEQKICQLSDIPEYKELASMQEREVEMRDALERDEFASPIIKGSYERGLSLLQEKTEQLAASSDLQDKVALMGAHCLSALDGLDSAHAKLQDQQLEDKERSLKNTLASVMQFYEKYGTTTAESSTVLLSIAKLGGFTVNRAVMAQAETKIKADAKAKARADKRKRNTVNAEMSQQKTKVDVRFRANGFILGKTGTLTPYSTDKKLAEVRKQCLFLLAENPADRLSIPEMLDEIGVDVGELGTDRKTVFSGIREWLQSHSYMGQQLIIRHGQSTATEYGWSSDLIPKIRLEDNSGNEPEPDMSATDQSSLTPSQIIGQLKENKEARRREAIIEVLDDEIEVIDGLRASSLFMVAHKLNNLARVLKDYGLPAVADELVSALSAYIPADIKKLNDINAYRQRAFAEVSAVIEDQERLGELIDRANQENDTITAEFVKFLTNLMNSEENRILIKRVLYSKPVSIKKMDMDKTMTPVLKTLIVDTDGFQIWPIPSGYAPVCKVAQIEPDSPIVEYPQAGVSKESPCREVVQMPDNEPEEVPIHQGLTPEQLDILREFETYGRNRIAHTRREQMNEVERRAETLAQDFVDAFGPGATPRLRAIDSFFHGFERGVMKFEKSRGKLQRGSKSKGDQPTYDIREFLHVTLSHDSALRNAVVARTNTKIIKRIIDRIATHAEEVASRT